MPARKKSNPVKTRRAAKPRKTGSARCLNVILLGTPGCGKSEVYRRIVKRLQDAKLAADFPRVDDFPKLWNIFQTDKDHKRCRPTPDGGYKVTDNGVWDDILKQVDVDVRGMQKSGRVLFIEFARPNMVHSILQNFSTHIVKTSLVVYIDCPFDTCWARNVARHERAVAAGSDDHLVSREEMEVTYGTDDHVAMLKDKRIRSISIDNATDDLARLDRQIGSVVAKIKTCLKS